MVGMSDQQPPVPPQTPEEPRPQEPQPQEPSQGAPASVPRTQVQPEPQPHTGGQQAAPEWIPVPPQNPFAQGETAKPGKGLGIAAMCLGLAGLLTAVVAAFYFGTAALVGGALGFAALILGVIALVKKQRPIATSLTGLISGALAVLLGLVVGVLSIGILALSALDSNADTAAGTNDWQEESEEPVSLIEWPANMATGGIVFGEQLDPRRSEPLQPGEAPATPEVNRESGQLDIRLYVDYRCPYCALFEQANGPALAELVSDGAATLEVIPLTFLDRVSAGSFYSSRAASAIACVVDGQPEAAWAAHSALLDPAVQPAEGGVGLSNKQLAQVLHEAVGGLNGMTSSCVESERFASFAQALNSWVFSNPVPGAVDPTLQVTGTPFVVVNGEPYTGDPADAAAFKEFLALMAGY